MKETHKKSQTQLNPVDALAIHLASSVKKLDNEIKKNIQDKEVIVTSVASHLIMGKGKKIRPLLTLLFAKILKYKGSAHFNLAVCIEFIHNATLLHDDVIDDAKIRRGKKAANLIWGNKLSILVGDYLLSKSFKLMVKDKSIRVLEILSNTSLILARGQIQDANNISSAHLTEKDYLELIFAASPALPALGPAVLAADIIRHVVILQRLARCFPHQQHSAPAPKPATPITKLWNDNIHASLEVLRLEARHYHLVANADRLRTFVQIPCANSACGSNPEPFESA